MSIAFSVFAGWSCIAHAAPASSPQIRHVVIIVQESRSFDQYFGTFPGADGIPPNTCVPLEAGKPNSGCVVPFHDPHDVNGGGPHMANAAQADLGDGIRRDEMDGFLGEQAIGKIGCEPDTPGCAASKDGVRRHDAVGYHTQDEIPNYWAYAKNFVLQDRLFAGVRSGAWPSHLDLVSEWAATCTDSTKASTCTTGAGADSPHRYGQLPWANLFQLLDSRGVSWKYYLSTGAEPDCDDDKSTCAPRIEPAGVPPILNPVPFFNSVLAKGPGYLKMRNPSVDQFLMDVKNGTLPKVSWVVPSSSYSEQSPSGVTRGMEYVTSVVNAVMRSFYWRDTVIFVTWDDWGGFYDHVAPPNIDKNFSAAYPIEGFGMRVPGLTISAYAKAGTIDHQVLSSDSYTTFIEDVFMNGARLTPTALGVPDKRPDKRDSLTEVRFPSGSKEPIGDLMNEFDFTQKPLKPLPLSTHIPTGITAVCSDDDSAHCTRPTVTIRWAKVGSATTSGHFTYHVTRDGKDLPQCTGIANTCRDKPGSGVHLYRAYSVSPRGIASHPSAAAEADEP